MMCDARLFEPQLTCFGHRHPCQVVRIDQHESVPELAAAVLALAPERFALTGLSMGGIVAMEMIRQSPDRIAGVALLDTNPLAESPDKLDMRDRQITAVGQGGLSDVMREEMKPRYLAETPRKSALLDLCMDMALDLGSEVFVRQSKALATRVDQRLILSGFESPSLILCGEFDALCPLERHELMRDLMPNATLKVIRNAGHLPTLEQPEATNAALENWIGQVEMARAKGLKA